MKDNIENKEIMPIKQKGGRKKSDIRKFYEIKNSKFYCNIGNCTKFFSTKSSVSLLRDHIREYHQIINNNMNNNTINNKIIDEGEIEEPVIYRSFAIAFAKNSLPHSLISNPYFKEAIGLLNSNYKITKSKLRETIISEGEKINNDILNMLSANNQPITLALDGWTNIRSNKVTNIILICSGIAYYHASIENEKNMNNLEWLIPKITEIIELLIKRGLNIIAITTDNENLMKSLRKKIKIIYPVLINIPCSAHIIQLCFKKICHNEKLKSLIDKTIKYIDTIRDNKVNKIKLLKLQENENIKEPLKLIRPIEIRWISLIISIERFIKLRNFIEEIIEIDLNYWDDLNCMYIYLEPFKKAINQIQKDNASLYSVWKNFQEIINYYNSNQIPKIFNEIVNDTINVFKNKWNDHINNNLIEAIRLLNLEDKFKFEKQTIEFIINWGSTYLTTYKTIKNENIQEIKNILSLQMGEFISRQNDFSSINIKNTEYINMCKIQNRQHNIKFVWTYYLPIYYELSKVAIALLSICPSEASVERSFSMQSDTHSPDRNRLSNEVIEAEMNIKINIK
jgi:hypothetical protein